MKPLTPEEQFQMQLDVQSLKAENESMKKEIDGLVSVMKDHYVMIEIMNKTILSHHGLLIELGKKAL